MTSFKRLLFATLYGFAAIVLLIAASCKKETFESCTLSVTEVTEHSIAGQCVYTPNDNENGYILFLTYTDELTDEMRNQMLEYYRENGVISESRSFTLDSLVSGITYYIMAVTFCEKAGNASIVNVKSLKQATMASNDSRVTVNNASSAGATFNVQVTEKGYSVSSFSLNIDSNHSYSYSASVEFSALSDSDETQGNNCYSDGKLVCTVSFVGWPDSHSEMCSFYGTDQNGKKYKAKITVVKWYNKSVHDSDKEFHIY